jgi:glycine/D-amino acid oxidase-like deaminating enzyme
MNDSDSVYDAVIIGGGFFGCSLAIQLRKKHERVLIIEMGNDILKRASFVNQARVHNGYHYPRSLLTALRSRINSPRFLHDYHDCIFSEFEQYYAIGKNFSRVTANQYRIFMERIGAEITTAPKWIRDLTNPSLIETVFSVKEFAFDAVKLRHKLRQDLIDNGIELWLNVQVGRLSYKANQGIEVHFEPTDNISDSSTIITSRVYNCTYSHINQVLRDSQIPILPLKHEITEMALLELPEELHRVGVTVMCGPFFSFMPFPPLGVHTLSHVRYTPHYYWIDNNLEYHDTYKILSEAIKKSHALQMVKDAQRYIPLLNKSRYIDSLWEIKTVLPSSEVDDSRPIMLKKDYGLPGLTCILGGKIDNIYDVFDALKGDPN